MAGGQFGDTTYTKVFVGGLAWETKKETMRQYFEQFGEILEAVIITDKNTGRSKGYGFVTFRDPDSAMRACLDPTPVIDGRRANCNIASLGAHRSRSAGGAGKFRMVNTYPATGIHGPYTPYGGATFSAAATTACPPAYYSPYQTFGYSPYAITAAATGTAETANAYSFHPNFLGHYLGMGSSSSSNNQQLYNPSPPPTAAAPAPFYQYYQIPQPLPSSQNFSLNYTPFFQYPAVAAPTPPAPSAPTMSSLQQPQQQYAAMMSITSGMTMAAVQHVPHQATVYQLPAPASQNGAAAAAAVSVSASAPPSSAESIHDLNPAV